MGAENARPAVVRGRLATVGRAIYEFFRRCVLRIICAGPIPKHVAFIMDGNRRYASRRQMNKCSGHQFGYESLMNTLRDCYDLGVKCVSVYAFSIENFRRPEEEVSMLMNLMHEKLEALIDKESMAREYGIRVQVLGDLSLFPERVRTAAERAMAVTKGNDKAVLNICAPYTSTQEIVRAVQEVCDEEFSARPELRRIPAVKSTAVNGKSEFQGRNGAADERPNCDCRESGNLTLASAPDADNDKELKNGRGFKDIESEVEIERRLQGSITADDIERHLYTSTCPEPELLIRTSGETRLSNFFLWQSSCSYLHVTGIMWPEFSFRHLIMAVIEYQKTRLVGLGISSLQNACNTTKDFEMINIKFPSGPSFMRSDVRQSTEDSIDKINCSIHYFGPTLLGHIFLLKKAPGTFNNGRDVKYKQEELEGETTKENLKVEKDLDF